jgi:tight adherence protein B
VTLLAALAAAVGVGLALPGTGRGLARLEDPPGPVRSPASRSWWPLRRRRAEAERVRVVEFASALAAEVRAGRSGRPAVLAAVDGLPPSPWSAQVRAAAAGDGDVGAALDQAARDPGSADLRDVAACWRVAERTGAGLGAALEEVAAAAGERSAHAARVRAQLAGVRTTGWLLALLPVLGMVLASGAGARPWEVLLGSGGGFGLLVAGLALDALGVAWLCRMARRVEAA